MTPEIPGYLLAFESTVRPLVVAIALGLIWMGAARMEGPPQSRYTTTGALSVTLSLLKTLYLSPSFLLSEFWPCGRSHRWHALCLI